MEDPTAAAQIPRRAPTPRAARNPCLLHHHDRLLPANPPGVRHQTPPGRAEGRSNATTRSHRRTSRHDRGQRHHWSRLHPDQDNASPSIGTRYAHTYTHRPTPFPQTQNPSKTEKNKINPPTNKTGGNPQQTAKPTSSSTPCPSSSPSSATSSPSGGSTPSAPPSSPSS